MKTKGFLVEETPKFSISVIFQANTSNICCFLNVGIVVFLTTMKLKHVGWGQSRGSHAFLPDQRSSFLHFFSLGASLLFSVSVSIWLPPVFIWIVLTWRPWRGSCPAPTGRRRKLLSSAAVWPNVRTSEKQTQERELESDSDKLISAKIAAKLPRVLVLWGESRPRWAASSWSAAWWTPGSYGNHCTWS